MSTDNQTKTFFVFVRSGTEPPPIFSSVSQLLREGGASVTLCVSEGSVLLRLSSPPTALKPKARKERGGDQRSQAPLLRFLENHLVFISFLTRGSSI